MSRHPYQASGRTLAATALATFAALFALDFYFTTAGSSANAVDSMPTRVMG